MMESSPIASSCMRVCAETTGHATSATCAFTAMGGCIRHRTDGGGASNDTSPRVGQDKYFRLVFSKHYNPILERLIRLFTCFPATHKLNRPFTHKNKAMIQRACRSRAFLVISARASIAEKKNQQLVLSFDSVQAPCRAQCRLPPVAGQ